ncbi:MAG: two-component sensor histidine kinase [Candidatus Marinimicrobia bacterium]|nr:two-component sensor histidine kinase [Candidatus Neomarinimicrobiota bacterium]|tara:strand:- start:2037 stop:3200 length:1164 start_codon:yes stop_codon:yes gene_type:complete
MDLLKHSSNIKAALFLLGFILVIFLFTYTQGIVNELRKDNGEIVKLYAEIIAQTISDENDTNLDFVFDEIIQKAQFPIIYSNNKKDPVYSKNINTDKSNLRKIQSTMDEQNEAIPLRYANPLTNEIILIGYLHYGDSSQIEKLKWLPFIEIGAITLFILLGFISFSIIRNSEKRNIWVGMARETAHQLGTPISSLMGWLEWMKNKPNDQEKIIDDISLDLERLQQVSDRFSKMGSETKIEEVHLSNIVDNIVLYFNRRIPSMGKSIIIENQLESDLKIRANGILISWAIENVVKNAIDALDNEGIISLKSKFEKKSIIIVIEDSGKGISRKNWKNIFRPGFSTKEQGWGLGLSLTSRIINEIHGGSIYVSQSKPGQGSTIEISLPKL